MQTERRNLANKLPKTRIVASVGAYLRIAGGALWAASDSGACPTVTALWWMPPVRCYPARYRCSIRVWHIAIWLVLNPQGRANADVIFVDTEAIVYDRAVVVD